MKKIKILDTTLRDGEQTPDLALSPQQKLTIAKQLASLNVDIIEVGFPASNQDDFEAAKLIAQQVNGPVICGFARATENDIDAAYKAIKYAQKRRIHTFFATSSIHLNDKLKKSEEEALNLIKKGIEYAKTYPVEVQFTPEDASRTNFEYMMKTIQVAIKAGATIINIADTVGESQPFNFYERVSKVYQHYKQQIDSGEIELSVHCHNDKGQAVANSLMGILAGATQVECCINGIGERTGNAALEEVVMNIFSDREYFQAYTQIKTKRLYQTAQLISQLTQIPIPGNKPIVGYNAFRHESGIHQHGVINNPKTYEVFNPEDIGWQGERFAVGKHSGKHIEEYLATQNNLKEVCKK